MSPIVFFIEGNIGTGKSTFIKNLQKIYNCNDSQFIQEPVDVWKDTKDNDNKNILEYFYQDMHRFCYLFQSYAFISRINQIDQIDKSCEFVFIERSVFCDKNVFAKTCHETGVMNDIEWTIYNEWFKWMEEKYKHIFETAITIYLQCSPTTSYQRIQMRSRKEEESIPFEYIENLHNKHEDWLVNDKDVIIVDAEENLLDKKILQNINNNILKAVNYVSDDTTYTLCTSA